MTNDTLYTSFHAHVLKKFPAFMQDGSVWLCAVSGGVDSMVLAHLLLRMGVKTAVAHCNFHLRGEESCRDAGFVKKWTLSNGLPLHYVDFDTCAYAKEHSVSIEMAAREQRYDFFRSIVRENGYAGIILAHHADDQIETILHNFTRGTSMDGYVGMAEIKDGLYRPMLPFSRAGIEDYARTHGVEWVEDRTNASTDYTRNKIRHHVVPTLKDINPSMCASVYENTEYMREIQTLYRYLTDEKIRTVTHTSPQGVKVNIKAIKDMGQAAKPLLYELMGRYGMSDRAGDLYAALDAQAGKVFKSSTHTAVKDREYIYIEENTGQVPHDEVLIDSFPAHIDFPCDMSFTVEDANDGEVTDEDDKRETVFDADKVSLPLTVRVWRNGDVFRPWGMGGAKKKISKYLKDMKIPLSRKTHVHVLTDGQGQVLWVVGYRRGDKHPLTGQTKRILKIKINNNIEE